MIALEKCSRVGWVGMASLVESALLHLHKSVEIGILPGNVSVQLQGFSY